MATINNTTDRNTVNGAILVTWPMGGADSGTPFALPFATDITLQVSGTFGGATVALQGSNDGASWFELTKKGGTAAASFTSGAIAAVNENPAFIRPSTSGGTGSAITVIVALHALFDKVSY